MKNCYSTILCVTLALSLSGQNGFTESKSFGNVTRNTKSNMVQNVMCMPDTVYHTDPLQAVTTFLTLQKSDFFGTINPSYHLERTTTTPAGTQFRFQQHVNNVPVIGGGIVASVNNEGVIATISNHYQPSIHHNTPSLIPSIDSLQAIVFSNNHLQVSHPQDGNQIEKLCLNSNLHALVWHVLSNDTAGSRVIVELDAHTGNVYGVYGTTMGSDDGQGSVFAPDPGTFYQTGCYEPSCMNQLNLSSSVVLRPLNRLSPPVNGIYALNGMYAWSPDSLNKMAENIFNSSPYDTLNYGNSPVWVMYPMGEINMYYHIDAILAKVHQLGFNPLWRIYNGEPLNNEFSSKVTFFNRTVEFVYPYKPAYEYRSDFIMCQGKTSFDQSVIAHELGHALHDSYVDFQQLNGKDLMGISEGFSDYLGISYRRQFNNTYRPNERFCYYISPRPETIITPETGNFQNMWPNTSDQYIRMRPYASALMDLEYKVSTNPKAGFRLGQDTVLTLQLAGFSITYITDLLRTNILNMYQADIDIYNGDHLQDLIEVYHSRKYFYSDSTQILEQDVTANQTLSSFFLLKDNRRVTNGSVLTISNNSRIVLGSDFTIDNDAIMVVGNNTRFFNRHLRHTIHVNGTLQIAGNTTLPSNIVVHNGGKLLINEGIAFAQQPGTVITVEQGGTVASNGAGITLTIANNWVIEPGTIFQNLGNTGNYGLVLQPNANMVLENVTFLKSNVKGMGNFAFTNCLFTRSNLAVTAEELLLDGCVFNRCVVSSDIRSFNTTQADIWDCQFLNGTGNYGLQLSGYQIYNVVNNLVEGNQGGGISVSNCGLSKPEYHLIRCNTIRNNNGGEALRLYNTVAVLMGNTISGNSHGIGLYHNCLVESFGDESSPQTISNNGTVQIQAVDNSFPWRFSYNRFEANARDTLINCFFNTANGGTEKKYRVEMNCWSVDFNPSAQFVPVENFSWSPIWDCNGMVSLDPLNLAEALMVEGNTALKANNIPVAKQRFEQVVAQFPQSPFAEAALKSLRAVYYSDGYSPQAFKQYLENETTINSSPELQKIAGYLRAETDLFLGNTQPAQEFYQYVISNPATPADEVYATIDAEYAGLEIGNKALTVNSFTDMFLQAEKHNKNRNLLLDGLKAIKTENIENPVLDQVADFTLAPNPACDFFDVIFPVASKGNITISVLAVDGRVVASQTICAHSEKTKVHRVTLPELNQGLYLVSSTFENGQKVIQKLIVSTL